jgi:choline dehydrogenase
MPYIERDEFPPPNAESDSELLDCARQRGTTGWHFGGTCRMGQVVDADLRFKGIDGLRIVDASVMPTMPSGNTGAPTMMVAEKAADLILGKAPLVA